MKGRIFTCPLCGSKIEVNAELIKKLSKRNRGAGRPPLYITSPSSIVEIEVMWGEGLSIGAIAEQTKIAHRTVKKYVAIFESRKKLEQEEFLSSHSN